MNHTDIGDSDSESEPRPQGDSRPSGWNPAVSDPTGASATDLVFQAEVEIACLGILGFRARVIILLKKVMNTG